MSREGAVETIIRTSLTYGRSFFEPFGMYCPRSDLPDEKLNSALLLSRRTYPPRIRGISVDCVGGNLPKLGR